MSLDPPSDATLRLLFLGDIVGEPGRKAVTQSLGRIREHWSIDFIVVNGENTAVTTGDHVWDQKEIVEFFPTEPRLLRPLNYPEGTPGNGSVVLDTKKGKVGVLQVQARTFTQPNLENPFLRLEAEVARLREETPVLFVDAHGETTSEKIALGRALDGQVSALVGTHTHVQTADEQIFPGGTAFLCDAGMCGPRESILGRQIDPVLYRFRTAMPTRFPVAKGEVLLCGAMIDINLSTGNAEKIERFQQSCDLQGMVVL